MTKLSAVGRRYDVLRVLQAVVKRSAIDAIIKKLLAEGAVND